MITINIAKVCCQFKDFSPDMLWKTWYWKIDPFQVSAKQNVQLTITRAMENSSPTCLKDKLLFEEKRGFFWWRVYSQDDGSTLWLYQRNYTDEVCLAFNVSSNWDKITLLEDSTNSNGDMAFVWLTNMVPGVLLKHKTLSLHAALVEHDGFAFAICAPSGTGKTTHARLWRDYKHALILNGDRAVFNHTDSVWTAYGTPWSGTSGEQINRDAPLKAVVVLERSETNEVQRLVGLEAFGKLLPHLLCPTWDKELVNVAMDEIDSLLQDIPVFLLKCRPDTEAVDVLYQALMEV